MNQDPDKHIIAAVSMAASIDTEALGLLIDLGHRTHLCLQAESAATGDRAGTFAVQGRLKGATNWNTIQSYTVTTSTLFNEMLDISNLGAEEIRLLFTHASGTTGTLDAWWVSKRGAM